jgi:hypothetical protein
VDRVRQPRAGAPLSKKRSDHSPSVAGDRRPGDGGRAHE